MNYDKNQFKASLLPVLQAVAINRKLEQVWNCFYIHISRTINARILRESISRFMTRNYIASVSLLKKLCARKIKQQIIARERCRVGIFWRPFTQSKARNDHWPTAKWISELLFAMHTFDSRLANRALCEFRVKNSNCLAKMLVTIWIKKSRFDIWKIWVRKNELKNEHWNELTLLHQKFRTRGGPLDKSPEHKFVDFCEIKSLIIQNIAPFYAKILAWSDGDNKKKFGAVQLTVEWIFIFS